MSTPGQRGKLSRAPRHAASPSRNFKTDCTCVVGVQVCMCGAPASAEEGQRGRGGHLNCLVAQVRIQPGPLQKTQKSRKSPWLHVQLSACLSVDLLWHQSHPCAAPTAATCQRHFAAAAEEVGGGHCSAPSVLVEGSLREGVGVFFFNAARTSGSH